MIGLGKNKWTIGSVLFRAAIWIAVPFWGLGVIKGLLFNGAVEILILDSLSFVISLVVFVLIRTKSIRYEYVVNGYASIWIVMFTLYWKYMDGLDGPFSYAFFTLMIFFVGVLEYKARMILVSLLVSINIFLTLYGELFPLTGVVDRSYDLINTMAVDYIFNSILIAALVIYLKFNFDIGLIRIHRRNVKLDNINSELDEKRERLISQKEMIVKIQNNLESLIKDRVQEQELRNQQLQEYAYHNTHMVRGPLTNILALQELMRKDEKSGISKNHLNEIKRHSDKLDAVIRKINLVLK